MPQIRAGWVPGASTAGVAAVGLVFLLATGVSPGSALILTLVVGLQGLTGALVWRWIRRRPVDVVESIGMGLALGTGLSVISGLVVLMLGLGTWGWAVPCVAVIVARVLVRVLRRDAGTLPSEPITSARGTLLAAVATLVLGATSLIVNVANYPLTWSGTWGRYHVDMLFFESLGTSLARLGPLDSIFMPGGVVRYHWLVYAWSGQVSAATSAEPFVVLTRVLPFVTILASSFLAIAWTQRLVRVPWAPTLAVALVNMGGYVGATYGAILNFDSPSQALSTVWLLGVSLAFMDLLHIPSQRGLARPALVGAIALLAFCLSGGKISSGAVAIAAFGIVALLGLLRRAPWRKAAVVALVAAGLAVVTAYVLIVAGSADPGGLKLLQLLDRASSVQGLNPIAGSVGIFLGTVILIVSIAVRWSGIIWLAADSETRWQPDTLLGIGFAVAGLATVVLISGGLNDTWFALAASAPLSVLSAVGAARGAEAVGAQGTGLLPARPAWWAAFAAAILFVLVALLWSTGASGGNVFTATARWLGPLVGVTGAVAAGLLIARNHRLHGSLRQRRLAMTVLVLVLLSAPGRALGVGTGEVGSQPGLSEDAFSPQTPFADAIDNVTIHEWTSDHAAAATWLREHALLDQLVATNVTFSPFVPALTGMQTLASGILYAAPYGRPANVPAILEREQQSWAFIDTPSAATAAPLCAAGVRWLWVDPTRTQATNWLPYADVEFANPAATILEFDPGRCGR